MAQLMASSATDALLYWQRVVWQSGGGTSQVSIVRGSLRGGPVGCVSLHDVEDLICVLPSVLPVDLAFEILHRAQLIEVGTVDDTLHDLVGHDQTRTEESDSRTAIALSGLDLPPPSQGIE